MTKYFVGCAHVLGILVSFGVFFTVVALVSPVCRSGIRLTYLYSNGGINNSNILLCFVTICINGQKLCLPPLKADDGYRN